MKPEKLSIITIGPAPSLPDLHIAGSSLTAKIRLGTIVLDHLLTPAAPATRTSTEENSQ
jgi:hypothetical protein